MAGFARVCEGVTAGLALVLAGSPLSVAETVMERPFSKHAMVVSACPLASEAGVEIMRQGGNAFDAAACTGFVMAVTWPEAGNLGGGGFMVARKGDGEVVTLDFRETVRDGRAALVLGSPGGSTIITTVMQVFLNVALHGMDIQDAVAAPRHHAQWTPDEIFTEPNAFTEETRAALEGLGHRFNEKPSTIGAANCILIGHDGLHGAPDPRRQSSAKGF